MDENLPHKICIKTTPGEDEEFSRILEASRLRRASVNNDIAEKHREAFAIFIQLHKLVDEFAFAGYSKSGIMLDKCCEAILLDLQDKRECSKRRLFRETVDAGGTPEA